MTDDLENNKSVTLQSRFAITWLSVIAVFVGVVTGYGAIFFRALIALIHNIAFYGNFSLDYDANLYTDPSPFGPLIILAPIIGGFIVVFLVKTFAPEARGHGVPEVMDAIFYKDGKIRPVVAVVKSIASALSIGTGAAVGREGPIIQIGSSIGSTVGQIAKMESWQRLTLVAAGAGAGIAATFNTPIGGVLFAIELMMPEVSVRTFLPVALATGTATFIGQHYLGVSPAFEVPPLFLVDQNVPLYSLGLYAVLGLLMGVASTAFIRGLHFAEEFFEKIQNQYLRNLIGMSLVGGLFYVLLLTTGHYHTDGVGYATIQDLLTGGLSSAPLLAILFFAKLAATSTSLGAGASGGIFSPSLFMGATLGGAFGAVILMIFPNAAITVPAFAMVGMAAMVGGGTGAAMTAVTMTFEMTRDYDIVMPMILAVAIAIAVRRTLSRENIYTIKLVSRRHFIPKALHANMFLVRPAGDVMDKEITVLPAATPFDEFLRRPDTKGDFGHVVVTEGGRIVGVVRVNLSLRRGLEGAYTGVTLGEIATKNFTLAHEDDIMFNVIGRAAKRKASLVVVVKKGRAVPRIEDVVGVIAKEHIADSVADSVRPYASADGNTV
ncbi:MAG: chloride channel protein [Parvularculaceae bacterium]